MSAPRTLTDPLRQAAEHAAAALLERPLDRVVAGSFAFIPRTHPAGDGPAELEVRWVEIALSGPPPPDHVRLRWESPDVWADCARTLPFVEILEQAPAIVEFIGQPDPDRRLRAQ